MDQVQRLCALGVPPQVAHEIVRQIAAATIAAVQGKPAVAALNSGSTAAQIVAALQA